MLFRSKDTLRPALVGVFSIIIYVAVAALLLEPYGILSLMIADAVKHAVHMGLMVIVLARQGVWLGGHGILNTLIRSAVAAMLTGAVAYAVFLALPDMLSSATLPGRFLLVLLPGVTGLIVFTALVYLLDIQEAKSLSALVSRRSSKQEN